MTMFGSERPSAFLDQGTASVPTLIKVLAEHLASVRSLSAAAKKSGEAISIRARGQTPASVLEYSDFYSTPPLHGAI